jgi:hypothetical protein
MSCQSWSSVDVTYVHPPHVRVRNTPIKATNLGSVEFGRAVRRYHKATSANRGPGSVSAMHACEPISFYIPDVIAMKIMKKERSGYRSPMVEDTEGNHSSG